MELYSKSFKDGDILPQKHVLNAHGCTGLNISPSLEWQNAPSYTKSFALVVHDPDAPVPNGWYHWIVLNIPNNVFSVQEGKKFEKPAFEVVTSFQKEGYGGACPPAGHGVHHYNFTLYALDRVFDASIAKKTPVEVEKNVKDAAIASAVITALYERK